jgi:hypothetical protein
MRTSWNCDSVMNSVSHEDTQLFFIPHTNPTTYSN